MIYSFVSVSPCTRLVRNFLHLFSKISLKSRSNSRRFRTKGIYRGYEYLSNNNKIMDIDIDLELEMKMLCREL